MNSSLQEVSMMDWQLTCMWRRSPLQLSGCYQVLSPIGDTQLILPQYCHICFFSWHISPTLAFTFSKSLFFRFSSQRAELAGWFNKGHSGNEVWAWRWLSGGKGFRPPNTKRLWGPQGSPGASMWTAQSDMADCITNISWPLVDITIILSMLVSRVQHHQLLHQLS